MIMSESRRVSFSDRVYYSDDISMSTTATDEDEDASIQSDDVPQLGKEKSTVDTAVDDKNVAVEKDDEKCEFSESSSILDEPPLVFRDAGIWHRPDEYLGGYQPQDEVSRPKNRFKLRKSWLEEYDEEKKSFQEFGAWKQSRLAASKDNAKVRKWNTNKDKELEQKDKKEVDEVLESKPMPADQGKEMLKESEIVINSASPSTQPVQETIEKKIPNSTTSYNNTEPKTEKTTHRMIPPPKKDKEMEDLEKEILELKEKIPKLQRHLDTIKVREISDLADLEEETTKTMREYREKAHHIGRKLRAKEEKKALKEKSMKSEDLISHLRQSNQKIRAGAVKMKAAIAKLRSQNQQLNEKKLVHGDFAVQFENMHEIEIDLAEEMQRRLLLDAPKYESLILEMENAVTNRDSLGEIEHKKKCLYLNCTDAIMDMLEENCEDTNLMDTVFNLVADAGGTSNQPGFVESSDSFSDSYSLTSPRKAKGVSREAKVRYSVSSAKSSSRRKSTGTGLSSSNVTDMASMRRSINVDDEGGRRSSSDVSFDRQQCNYPRQSSSFRGTRTPKGTLGPLKKMNSKDNDDDSSTCSCTSVNSGSFSMGSYEIDMF